MFGFLRYLFRSRRLGHLHLVLFTRRGCHLCEEAELLLQKEQQRYHYQLDTVNVDSQKSLAAQFGDQVPVVTVNGQIRFRGRINLVLLSRLLRAEARQHKRADR
jgi:glutaredoxin